MTQQPWRKGYVPTAGLDEYAERYADFAVITRRDGILEVRFHTDGGPYVHSFAAANAWNRMWQDVANDLENEVLILTGTGDLWFTGDADALYSKPLYDEDPDFIYEHLYDGQKAIETFLHALEIPTIGVLNGPGFHTELGMLCDITLAAPDVDFRAIHFLVGAVPGDGHLFALQALMGPKRAAYFNYTADSIPADEALRMGLVNEVLPREALLPRAWALAETIMERPRWARRMTHALAVRPWRKLATEDLAFHFAAEIMAQLGCKEPIPMRSMIEKLAAQAGG